MPGPGARPPRQRVDGVLLLDKPSGVSSNAALQRARRALNAEKAGHTGTLDPLASGLLPLCFGEATKFARFLLDADKRYTATVRFGAATTTQDAEGEVVATGPVPADRAAIEAALPAFRGALRQVPPAYSALKHQGRKLYDYARAGIEVPRPPRDVHVAALTLRDWRPPDAVVDVACSKGTYVRALAADLGAALGTVAHLAALRRDATGGFALADAVALEALEAMAAGDRVRRLLPADVLLRDLPCVALDAAASDALRHGRTAPGHDVAEGVVVCARDPDGRVIGIARGDAGRLVAVRMAAETARQDRPDAAQDMPLA